VVLLAGAGFGVRHWTSRAGEKAAETGKQQLWTCPMHPSVIRTEPGSCPICGMDLVPMEETKPSQESTVEGRGVVEISPEKQQLIGVVTTAVQQRQLSDTIRTVGIVVPDEERLSDVHTKIEGWVEKLYADQTGKLVKRGEPLLTIYSPDLVSTQEEYLLALRSRERVKDSPFEEVRRGGDSMVAAARQRLELWDISQPEIRQLEKTGKAKKALTLYAPSTGYVMEKQVVEGMKVTPDMTLLRLADLSHVWVDVDVYEYQAPKVSEGMTAVLTTTASPGVTFPGKVTYIYPSVEAQTRTLKARMEFANPGLKLKPGMYGDVTLQAAAGESLAIPEDSVIDSGERKVVFIKSGEGTFVPREVKLGSRAAGFYPVLDGLKEGEEIVSSPNFLIDSESQFAAALQQMKMGSEHEGHGK